uniref:Secreted protein n=1 Tax=Steinernema glaseri TaxID=37863 RepID=A0A1I8AVB1_9BILA
ALTALCLASQALASASLPRAARVKRWFGGYGGGYDLGYAYGWQFGEIIALICGILAFLICICCPCICFMGIWFAGWFGLRQKRSRPRETVHLTSQAAPPPAAAPTIIQQNPPPTHFAYNSAPPPPAHGEPDSRGQYVYAQDRYYERRRSPSREKYYR